MAAVVRRFTLKTTLPLTGVLSVIATMTLFFTGCGSKELTPSRAADLIQQAEFADKVQWQSFYTGNNVDPDGEHGKQLYIVLEKAGWVKRGPESVIYDPYHSHAYVGLQSITITDQFLSVSKSWTQGRPVIVGNGLTKWSFPVVVGEFVGITNISKPARFIGLHDKDTDNIMGVEYTWHFVLTKEAQMLKQKAHEIGEILSRTRSDGSTLCDDLWLHHQMTEFNTNCREKVELDSFPSFTIAKQNVATAQTVEMQLTDNGWRIIGRCGSPDYPC